MLQKKIRLIIALSLILACLAAGFGWYRYQMKTSLARMEENTVLELVEDEIVLEYASGSWASNNLIKSCSGDVLAFDQPFVDLSELGEHLITITVSSSDRFHQHVSRTVSKTVTVADNSAPVITFRQESVSQLAGYEFDALANLLSVEDPVDGKLELSETLEPGTYIIESAVNNIKVGTYTVSVSAMDFHGNSQSASYNVTIQPASSYYNSNWNGQRLTPTLGTIMGPSGKETYYNLDMTGVIAIMRRRGNTDPYWIREDGCKMLGPYIMIAANLDIRPRGTLVPTSLGMGIVCDTGAFAHRNIYQIDIAVDW